VPTDEQRLLFFDESLLAEQSNARLVPPPLEKLGPVLLGDSPGDSASAATIHSGSIIVDDHGNYRLNYTGHTTAYPQRRICVAKSNDGLKWTTPPLGQLRMGGKDTNRILIPGLPADAWNVQPIVLRLADGRYRMYFWLHTPKPPRKVRYLAAESTDGLHWRVLNLDKPCLRHPADSGDWAWLEGTEARKQSGGISLDDYSAIRRIRSNDAAIVYQTSDGYELYADGLLWNPPDSGHHVASDSIPTSLRVIHRRISEDGLTWSPPELVITPDHLDPWDMELYYLAQHRLGPWRIGFLGAYRAAQRTIDVEFVYRRDGRVWHRPMRGPWLPRGPHGSLDSEMVFMPGPFIDKGSHWLSLYTGTNFIHHMPDDRWTVHALRIPKYRLAGLRSEDPLRARVRTRPFVPWGPRLLVDADIWGQLWAELCDVFGRPRPGYELTESVPLADDSVAHELRWKNAATTDYQYEGVSLRLEWTDGTVYGLVAS